MNFLSDIRRRKIFFSDFIVRYPAKQKLNKHVLNLHRERWEYPAKKTGFNYESVDTLLQQSCERIVSAWEKIETCLYGKIDPGALEEFKINAYTGKENAGYYNMKIKNPVRLYY